MAFSYRVLILAIASLILNACQPSAPAPAVDTSESAVIYTAQHIITMDADRTEAESEAVVTDGGVIKAVGQLSALKAQFPSAQLNTDFADKTLIPGLIDPHVHMTLGAMMYGLDFVPPWDMEHPTGTIKGLPDKAAFLARVTELEAQAPDGPLILYGYHNLVHGHLDRHDLDGVTTTRPLFIWHYSGHDFYLNSAAIKASNLTPALAERFHGVDLDTKGALTGRIYEDAALALFATVGPILLHPEHIERGFTGFETLLARAGVTTVADLGYGIFGRPMEDQFMATHYSLEDAYRLYLVPEHRAFTREFGDAAIAQMQSMAAESHGIARAGTAKVLPQVKLFTDAAFYSQTMRLDTPGYIGGQSQGTTGLWVTPPKILAGVMRPYWGAGLDIHIHSNGDAAQTSTLAAFEAVKNDTETQDGQRLVIEHAGLLRPEHLRKAGQLGVGLSAASHYVFYMGETYETAIGERVKYITPLRSALAEGLPVTVHSDAPLAPPQPLRAASVHMTRSTREGGVSTPSEQLTPEQALRVITLDAAWSLGLDKEIGSISVGKRADFTVLGANPLETPAEDWPTIPVWGVVIEGKAYTTEIQLSQ